MDIAEMVRPADYYGEHVFSIKVMRNYLSETAHASLAATIQQGRTLDGSIADEVADAMKSWALELGATHFTHWFQPLTGATAEKHDSFVTPDHEGGAVYQFSGKELILGEPDASSFPSGGLRATFEARGYTAWDPTSPAFIKDSGGARTLCIPTVFCGYRGEALDKKTPLLRSIDVLGKQIIRLGKLFGIDNPDVRPLATLGLEQEYFLVDKELVQSRLDLLQTGRTLFGRSPAKHQQMDDHYFGAIKSRVLNFMAELDSELWRLGIPAKTRHNEVCPAQFELAPVFEEQNLAVDHNMLTMEIMREVAERHEFSCLLHEKPFAGVNGSGKHNNWAVCGPDGKNWLTPGDDPHENAKFLTVICALMMGVDRHAGLLRSTVASAGNDHRLGANEAPPAIISIFLGDQLSDVIEQIEHGAAKSSKSGGVIEIGVSSLPPLPRDATDRNRTSPFAFTGNKFEFRALGSNQSSAGANVVLNTIVAEALDEICTSVEAGIADGKELREALQPVLQDVVKKHKRILFNGDNYTDEWVEEAELRGLPNLKTTPEALEQIVSEKSIELFKKYPVLTERELKSRHEIYLEGYEETICIEARCAVTIVRTEVLPATLQYQQDVAETIAALKSAGQSVGPETQGLLGQLCDKTERLFEQCKKVELGLENESSRETLVAMNSLRETVDALEALVPNDIWPLVPYAEMMFI